MLNLKRLFRRQDTEADDLVLAYVEGRADAGQAERVERMMAESPAVAEEIESLRRTVTLLRSIPTVPAPRSFALTAAPEMAKASVGRRFTLVPATMAAVAALFVGVLTVGDLTGTVSQTGSGQDDATAAQLTMTAQLTPEATPEPSSRNADSSITGLVPEPTTGAPSQESALEPGMGTFATTAVPAPSSPGGSAPEPTTKDLPSPEGVTPLQTVTGGEPAPSSPEGVNRADAGDEGDLQNVSASDSGLSLPIWQLQAAFGGLAAVMAATWAFLRRRTI